LSKDRKSLEKAEKEGFDFIPLAVETFGVWSTLALETLKKMCSRLRQYSSLDSTYPHFYYLMQELSVGKITKTQCKPDNGKILLFLGE